MRGSSSIACWAARRTLWRSAWSSGRKWTSAPGVALRMRAFASSGAPGRQHFRRFEADAGVGPGDDHAFARLVGNVGGGE
jgi:hypothetical protein